MMAVDYAKVKLIDEIRNNIHHLHAVDKARLQVILDLITPKGELPPCSGKN
jgi:hypothetical protein